MEKFNAKDYIIGDVQELTRQKTNGTNFTVKLLPDGKKGFIISRTKKRMTVDYENYRILDETEQEMDAEGVYKFMSALRCDCIDIPEESGFSRIYKGKACAYKLHDIVTSPTCDLSIYGILREFTINDFAVITLDYGSSSWLKNNGYIKIRFEDVMELKDIWLHYMTQKELAAHLTYYGWELGRRGTTKQYALVERWKTIKELRRYYTDDELFIYLDEWAVAVQHTALPSSYSIQSLFNGYQTPARDIALTEIDLANGCNYSYARFEHQVWPAGGEISDEKTESPKLTDGVNKVFTTPSREKIEIPINDFTQMAVYGAIAQGFAHTYLDNFFREWRRNIDYQIYYNGQITDIAPRNIVSSNRRFAEHDVRIIAKKVAEAYQTKRGFYMHEITALNLDIPHTFKNGTRLTLASEEDVVAMITRHYQTNKGQEANMIFHIWHMMRTESIPLNIINAHGDLIDTHFYDISILTGGRKKPKTFKHDHKTYHCAVCSLYKTDYLNFHKTHKLSAQPTNDMREQAPFSLPFINTTELFFKEWLKCRANTKCEED